MSRHNVIVTLSRPQAGYLLDAIDTDLEHGDLNADETDRAGRTRAKIDRALGRVEERVKCDDDCSCRRGRRQREEADHG